jgi:hypothetical protein
MGVSSSFADERQHDGASYTSPAVRPIAKLGSNALLHCAVPPLFNFACWPARLTVSAISLLISALMRSSNRVLL